MKFFCAFFAFAFACQGADATPPAPAFYTVVARDNGDAILHASAKAFPGKKELALVVMGSDTLACCFYFGPKKAGVKSSLKMDEDLPLLSAEQGEETYQLAGHVKGALAAKVADKLAFGLEGMTNVKRRDKRSLEFSFGPGSAPLTLKHCMGTEGINFSLYRKAGDKKPFASYYHALGYPVKSDCR